MLYRGRSLLEDQLRLVRGRDNVVHGVVAVAADLDPVRLPVLYHAGDNRDARSRHSAVLETKAVHR